MEKDTFNKNKYRIRLSDNSDVLSKTFIELRKNGSLFDVTLKCKDSEIQAHKIVLIAYSPFLKEQILNKNEVHPVINLQIVNGSEMKMILDFMYNGHIYIDPPSLADFVKVASFLKVDSFGRHEEPVNGTQEECGKSLGSLITSDDETDIDLDVSTVPEKRVKLNDSQENVSGELYISISPIKLESEKQKPTESSSIEVESRVSTVEVSSSEDEEPIQKSKKRLPSTSESEDNNSDGGSSNLSDWDPRKAFKESKRYILPPNSKLKVPAKFLSKPRKLCKPGNAPIKSFSEYNRKTFCVVCEKDVKDFFRHRNNCKEFQYYCGICDDQYLNKKLFLEHSCFATKP